LVSNTANSFSLETVEEKSYLPARSVCAASGPPELREHLAAAGRQASGKNTKVLTSILSLGGAPAASGLSNDVWNESRARPSFALS
jgi:hypothetical protein